MEKKTIQNIHPTVRDAYGRAVKSRADVDTMITLFKDIVKREPGFIQAREKLRDYERRKVMQSNIIGRSFAQLAASFKLPKIKSLTRKDPVEAMALCEDALAGTLDNPAVLQALADAAEAAGAMFIAVEALSIIRAYHPKNERNLRLLVDAMQKNNQAQEAVKVFQEIAARHPNDVEVQSELRATMAMASIERGQWDEEEKESRKKSIDPSEAVAIQMIEGTIHDADQARFVAEKYLKDLQENDSIDIRRKLADAYMIMEEYDLAIEQYKLISETLGTLDPAIDKAIENAELAKFDATIRILRENPAGIDDLDAKIAEIEQAKLAYRIDRAAVRVKSYPNDAILNYELATMLFDAGRIGDSIAYFQIARRSPQRRQAATLYLGRCFAANRQYDMAVEQFETALKEMDRMDKSKMETLYFLAETLEAAGQVDQAIEKYKEIYQNQASYRDVAERIQRYYDSRKSAES